MIYTEFAHKSRYYTVFGEYGADPTSGEVVWFCREYYSDSTRYFTTSEINAFLAPPLDREAKIREERRGHSSYPHNPGTLYDCQRCESECFCEPGFDCVHCSGLLD